jgi:hypothetical protein
MDIENFVNHAANPGPVFFERGVLDALCGLDHITPLNESELTVWLSRSPRLRLTKGVRLCSKRWQTVTPNKEPFGYRYHPLTGEGLNDGQLPTSATHEAPRHSTRQILKLDRFPVRSVAIRIRPCFLTFPHGRRIRQPLCGD